MTGIPAEFASRAEFDELVASLVAIGSIEDASKIYWDIRPSMHFETLEFRVADVCSTVDEAVMIAGLCRALAVACLDDGRRSAPPVGVRPEMLRAAKWRAARFGLEGDLVDLGRPQDRPGPRGGRVVPGVPPADPEGARRVGRGLRPGRPDPGPGQRRDPPATGLRGIGDARGRGRPAHRGNFAGSQLSAGRFTIMWTSSRVVPRVTISLRVMGDGRGEVHLSIDDAGAGGPRRGLFWTRSPDRAARLVDRWPPATIRPDRPADERGRVDPSPNSTFRTSSRSDRLEGSGRPGFGARPVPGCESRGAGMPSHRGRLSVVVALAATCALTGCVERRYTIRTDPPGALVIANGEPIGTTPVSKSFTFYGDRTFRIIKEGYQTQDVVAKFRAPWYDNIVTEFFTENLNPYTFRDEVEFNYKLQPGQPRRAQRRPRAGPRRPGPRARPRR